MNKSEKTQEKAYSIRRRRRLGDVVHSVAQPIAEVIDRTLGTNIKGCGACAKRRDKLNNLFNKET